MKEEGAKSEREEVKDKAKGAGIYSGNRVKEQDERKRKRKEEKSYS